MAFQLRSTLILLACAMLVWTPFALGQMTMGEIAPPPASISGTVMDPDGAVIVGAPVRLSGENQTLSQNVQSDNDGRFSFTNATPGAFQLTVTATGFATQTLSGLLLAGESKTVPPITLPVAAALTAEVQVSMTQAEMAEQQIEIEEKQRVLGLVPNFYVSYIPNAAPLTPKQKFKLAFRTVVDPFTFVMVAGGAGVEQWQNHFEEYGQGAQGYAKRFGAGYADSVSNTFIGSAILPSLLKQDPRYFYKGTGSVRSRALYAIANALICKGDNGRWQANYSNVLGSLAAGGISNLYYPSLDRNGVGLTFENAAVGLGASAVSNLFQEFIIRRLTPRAPKHDMASP